MMIAGPLMKRNHEVLQLAKSFIEMKGRKNFKQLSENEVEAKRAAMQLLKVLSFLRRKYGNSLTAMVGEGSGYIVVMGKERPTFDFLGVASRVTLAALTAAPDGYVGATAPFTRLMQNLGEASFDDCGLTAANQSAQSWALRGVGLVEITPFALSNAEEAYSSNGVL